MMAMDGSPTAKSWTLRPPAVDQEGAQGGQLYFIDFHCRSLGSLNQFEYIQILFPRLNGWCLIRQGCMENQVEHVEHWLPGNAGNGSTNI